MMLDVGHILLVLSVFLWSSGLRAEEIPNHEALEDLALCRNDSSGPLRLVGGSGRCTGTLELTQEGEWRPVTVHDWTLKEAALICQELDCGSAISITLKKTSSKGYAWCDRNHCVQSGSALRECVVNPCVSTDSLEITCSESVRLVDGTSLCSGRLEVKSDQSNQSWSSVCEADFDQQDAEVVCRELGCGAPSVLQGALYGEVEAPMWPKEFQCGGDESSLLDCRSSGSDRNSCSPGRAVGLTCSEPHRLVGGSGRCAGTLEIKQGEWRPVEGYHWNLKAADVICRQLDCGSAVSEGRRWESLKRPVWMMTSECARSLTTLRDCVTPYSSSYLLEITCLDSVRLVDGFSRCSGRLEVKSDQSNQSWSSVCEADFDQQDAEVVCRELGCGAPSVLQGALYGEVEAPMWPKEFQCGGDESSLLDCRSSGSDRNSCSPGRAVGLTCSEPVRLVGGSGRCAGTLEMKYEAEWRPVYGYGWSLRETAVFCRELNCGSAVSVKRRERSSQRSYHAETWEIKFECLNSGSALRDCVGQGSSSTLLDITCSDSVRLVNGTSLCSGRLEVKSDQSNQSWSSVCEADFDQQDAEVVCRELGCGAPSVLQGALYGEVEAPMWPKEFQCGGDESSLLDCRSSGSDRNSCSPGRAVGLTCSEPLRLVGGSSRCAGTLEVKQGEWGPVSIKRYSWTLKEAATVCRELDCGSAVSVKWREESSTKQRSWIMRYDCVQSGSVRRDCVTPHYQSTLLEITCSDSVRLVDGTSLCSGRLEVKSDQSNQSWSSVCEADFDQQDAEVVCRELGCGAPSVLQGALYGEVEAPMWPKEFQCGGDESSLLDCRSSGSDRNSCSPGRAVGLTCSESVRLVGGSSRCNGTLEMKLREWRPMDSYDWTLREAAVVCKELGCGFAVSVESRRQSSHRQAWRLRSECVQSGSALKDCITSGYSSDHLEITCSDSVRLVNGTSRCSGRLEVKSDQSNQSWSSVCEADFDQQDAEVVCRELGCGAPSVLQGALYGEVEAPMWPKEFQCGGNESSLLDCRSSGSDRNSCSPGRAVRLTCSEPLRLVGGSSRCNGTLEVKQGEWRPVSVSGLTLKEADVFCRELGCGSVISRESRELSSHRQTWRLRSECVHSGSSLKDCVRTDYSSYSLAITCSDSVRLVDGTSLCSGRLEVKSDQSNQSWSSVCEADFDQQDAEVVCRELGCGAPSVLQGALYGEVEAPMWPKEFQCGGDESSLLDCRSSGSDRNSCSPGRAVGLTCSEPVRLVGESSRCAGTLEMKRQTEWRPVSGYHFTAKEAAVFCRKLDCGSAVSVGQTEQSSKRPVWWLTSQCVHSGSALRDCVTPETVSFTLEISCLDSVRLVNGTSLCSGRLEVKSDQSNQSWSSVCEADFNQQDAEVVCRELGCGAPSVLQGALYGEVEAPMWPKEFQCGGDESSLLDCRSSGSDRNSCSPGRAVGLTCSEPLRLVGGSSRCAGTLEMKHDVEWRPVSGPQWTLKEAAVLCRRLDCGSAVSLGLRKESSYQRLWKITSHCIHSGPALSDCVTSGYSSEILQITCSDSVRLVNGTSRCSGRLEVKSDQSNQSWSSVCEADFDQQDAEVVCRELGCGAPSVLQGALYGEVEAPVWPKEFQCGGDESSLLDCRSSGSDRNSCSPGRAVGLTCSEPLRLVGGSSRCAGTLEVKRDAEWRPAYSPQWTLKEAAVICRQLDCGSAVSFGLRKESSYQRLWKITSHCVHSAAWGECITSDFSSSLLEITCSDSVRLVNGTSLCSGRLEVKSDQSNQSWSSVCEADFDQQDAEVVCRELGCGAPSVLQGALYGEVEAPMWPKEFQCGGDESSLLDCRSSGSDRNSCSPGRAVGLTCSEPLRLVGGSSRCAGTLEVKRDAEWRPAYGPQWTLKEAVVLCRRMDCGSAVSVGWREESPYERMWKITSECVHSGSALSDCATSDFHSPFLEITCSDFVKLVDGAGSCSGRLEVKSDQSNQSWSSVCEADFDQQDAEVVCRELGCGAPSVLQGALYGEVEAPMWPKEFQCGGDESSLLDCRSSGSDRNSCSPGRAVGLTCSEPLRLVGGSSRCAGTLEVKHQKEWRPVDVYEFNLKEADVFCRALDCGYVVSIESKTQSSFKSSQRPTWRLRSECVHSGSNLKDCVRTDYSRSHLEITCSDSVRLVDGTSLCSGRLEVKSDQSNQSWSSVCEADFDQQDAEVVCRELGCGAPSVLQGALYGEVEAPMWPKEFQCGGNESSLLDCRSSGSDRNSCSPGRAVELTCSEPVRLVGGSSRCAGTLEVKHMKEWRPVYDQRNDWTLKAAAVFCRELVCGSAVSISWQEESSERPVWLLASECVHSGSALRDCVRPTTSSFNVGLTCSDALVRPNISVSSEAVQQEFQVIRGTSFTVSCSIQPQYPGGSFLLTFNSFNTSHSFTEPAVNHSALFLFAAADPAHQGNFSCVYHVCVFSHNFSSESRPLSLTVSEEKLSHGVFRPVFIFALVLLLLSLLLYITGIYSSCKANKEKTSGGQMDTGVL